MGRLYEDALQVFGYVQPILFPVLFVINAPFGRFTPKSGRWTVDGIYAWMVMEAVSPLAFIYVYSKAPLSPSHQPPPFWHPATLLAALFIIHYLNRAFITPLRSPTRSRTHIIVPLAAVVFNSVNGPLMASWLSSGQVPADSYQRPTFWIAIIGVIIGLLGNILHDEILSELRRSNPPSPDGKPHYAIPHGYLYEFVSYPNYLMEWFEWLAFAYAASPAGVGFTPPWLFLSAEIATMLPRAWKGHHWYLKKFPDYPKRRKAVLPFLL